MGMGYNLIVATNPQFHLLRKKYLFILPVNRSSSDDLFTCAEPHMEFAASQHAVRTARIDKRFSILLEYVLRK